MSKQVKAVPDGYTTATPYLVVRGAAKAIEFYTKAFGAKELYHFDGPNDRIAHADLLLGTSHIMIADESEDGRAASPEALNGTPVSVFLYVDDVDATVRNAVRAGANETQPVQDMFWGDRYGRITDPFGHQWQIATHKEDVTPEQMKERMAAAYS